jgi:Fe2+ or Zn2+ uptake regulation protein
MACLILVWDSAKEMPTIRSERRRQTGGVRATCKADIIEVIREANQPLTRKEVMKELRQTRKSHGAGTVAKALADLTSTGELANPKDKKGYRMPEWMRRRKTPSLFD